MWVLIRERIVGRVMQMNYSGHISPPLNTVPLQSLMKIEVKVF